MLFINNKYTTVYYDIINNAKSRIVEGYTEKHHIIPKSLGGDNSSNNLVSLTAREHFICHWLLTKMTSKPNAKLLHAYRMMFISSESNSQRYIPSGRHYEHLKKLLYENPLDKSGKKNPFWDKTHTQETKDKISKSKSTIGSDGLTSAQRSGRKAAETRKNNKVTPWNKGKSGLQVAWNKGKTGYKIHSTTEKEKRSKRMKKNNPMALLESKLKVINANRKKWLVTFPDNTILYVFDMNGFCKDYNLNATTLRKVGRGGLKLHKNYKCMLLNTTT